MEPHIYLDRSGDLQTGYFYSVDFDEDVSFPPRPGPGEILVRCSPTEEELIREGGSGYFCTVFNSSFELEVEQRTECPVDPTHVTQWWWKNLTLVDGGDFCKRYRR